MNTPKTHSKSKEELYIVGIGASAGGLEAIHELFDNMPGDTGFAFVIVQHLSPDHKSLMPELLAKHSSMQIFEATNGMQVQKNCIYLMPNKSFMTIEDGKLMLTAKNKSDSPNTAIDHFLASLAAEKGKKAIAVILSGTGTDGTNGIEAIKAAGGIVIVQDPISAKFDGMPNSAITTGHADLILSPDMIAGELLEFLSHSPLKKAFYELDRKDEFTLRDILEVVYKYTSHDFSNYKRPTIQRRLSKRMSLKNIRTLSDYLSFLSKNPSETQALAKEFLIGVTKFFRDAEAFEELKTQVIKPLLDEKKTDEPIKVWVVACSTGEEVYSIAMLLHEQISELNFQDGSVKIFATDIDETALEIASRGVYTDEQVRDIPAHLLKKYFLREGKLYRVTPMLRKMIVFANHNVLKDPPYSKIDILSCRNMLIYMNSELQKSILRTFHFALNSSGYLFLGPSENLGGIRDGFKEISKKWKIYKNLQKSAMVVQRKHSSNLESKFNNPYVTAIKTKNALNNIPEIFKDVIVNEYKYAGILIDKELEVKQAIGEFKSFLHFPEGNFNLNLLKLVSSDLSVALSTAIRKAIKNNEKVVVRKIKIKDGEKKRLVNLIVKPYLEQNEFMQTFLFIVLSEEEILEKRSRRIEEDSPDNEKLLMEIEDELKETKENLQSAIEELETANEELQSSNEEMISANEELQSTNEELQSLNEELHTVNTEHQIKIKELIELNEDLNNYFNNTDIGQLLIDKKLIIRKFSPAVTRLINMIETDIGRSLVDISTNFQDFDFINAIKGVNSSGQKFERDVQLQNKMWYQVKITPYIKINGAIDGTVITFVNITEIRELNSLIQSIFNSSTSGIAAKRAVRDENNVIVDFEYIAANVAAEQMHRVKTNSLVGKRFLRDFHGMRSEHFNEYVNIVENGVTTQFEYYNEPDQKWYEVSVAKMMDGIVTTFSDITDKKLSAELINRHYEELKTASKNLTRTNTELEKINYDLMQFASVVSHDLKEPLRKIQTFGNMLYTDTSNKLSSKEQSYLERIIRSSERMRLLIDDLLSFSKLSNKSIHFNVTDLDEVISNIKEDLEIQIKEQGAEIVTQNLPEIEAISGQMRQLFQNLISNSLKFVNGQKPRIIINGGGLDAARAEEFNIKNPENYIQVSVADNGIGFDEKYKEKIFGLFQRLNTESPKSGTGIGLAICKKIIENHNGFITVTSTPAKGSTFRIILPKKQTKKYQD